MMKTDEILAEIDYAKKVAAHTLSPHCRRA